MIENTISEQPITGVIEVDGKKKIIGIAQQLSNQMYHAGKLNLVDMRQYESQMRKAAIKIKEDFQQEVNAGRIATNFGSDFHVKYL